MSVKHNHDDNYTQRNRFAGAHPSWRICFHWQRRRYIVELRRQESGFIPADR